MSKELVKLFVRHTGKVGDGIPLGYLEKHTDGYVLVDELDPSKGIPVFNGDTITEFTDSQSLPTEKGDSENG